jgi:hypothetical protein
MFVILHLTNNTVAQMLNPVHNLEAILTLVQPVITSNIGS